MQNPRNIQFTRLFKVDGYLKEFNFRKFSFSRKDRVSIDTNDERGNRFMFFMEKEDKTWKILPQELPKWVPEQEHNFDEAIQEEVSGVIEG